MSTEATETKKTVNIPKVLIAIFLGLPASIILRAYVVVMTWFWFVVPLGVMPIGLLHGMGLVLVFNLFKGIPDGGIKKPDPDADPLKGAYTSISFSLTGLLIGWIYSSFM